MGVNETVVMSSWDTVICSKVPPDREVIFFYCEPFRGAEGIYASVECYLIDPSFLLLPVERVFYLNACFSQSGELFECFQNCRSSVGNYISNNNPSCRSNIIEHVAYIPRMTLCASCPKSG